MYSFPFTPHVLVEDETVTFMLLFCTVLRSMDRGIQACDTLMRYLFLYMIPALAECVFVVIIFASYFHYLPIAVSVFLFVYAYVMATIILTVWRKKFRYR